MIIEREIYFLDGVVSEFKLKILFVDVVYCIEDFGFCIEKYFFGWWRIWSGEMYSIKFSFDKKSFYKKYRRVL